MAQINIIDYNKIVYFDENTGNYKIFDGERWWLSDDKFGTSTKPSGVALVDSAIVDKSVVGEEEPAMVTIWEGTFTTTETEQGSDYVYRTNNIQNSELLKTINEVNVTYDGTEYKLPVGIYGDYIEFGSAEEAEPPFSDYPFYFSYNILVGSSDVRIGTSTAGPHTLKVEGTPSGDEPSDLITLYDGTLPSGHYILQNGFWRFDIEESDLDFLSSYTDVTITRDNLEPVKLPVQVNGRYYGIAGGDAYPPTELTSPPSVMAAYQLIDGKGKAMIITENLGEDLAAYPHIKVQADPDDKRKQ